jgi:putative ABC transport system permease protein
MAGSLHIVRNFSIGMRTAVIEMGQHKLRSFLSMLGVMLGVAALVAMLSLIGGIQTFLKDKMGRWAGTMMLHASHADDVPVAERISWSRSPGLRLSDADYLDTASADVDEVRRSVDRRGELMLQGLRAGWSRVRGVTAATYNVDTTTIALDEGRLLSNDDYREGRRVCLLTWGLRDFFADRLKDRSGDRPSLVGRSITFRGIRFEVVGTLRPRDPDFRPWGWDRIMVIPLAAMQRDIVGSNPDPGWISIVVTDANRFDEQTNRIARALSGVHRGVTDFEYHGADWADNMKRMMNNIQLIMGLLAGVSLLVGGLGIMNVMLSSISERIKEIGVRKALGARRAQIFIQFLAETTTLSCTGGAIGALLGLTPMLFGETIKKSTQGVMMPTILPEHALVVLITIVSVGVVFGLYPALKASRMDPVDALRYE